MTWGPMNTCTATPRAQTCVRCARREGAVAGGAIGLLFGPAGLAQDVDAMVSALEGQPGRLQRHHLGAEEARALQEAVAGDPEAAPPPA